MGWIRFLAWIICTVLCALYVAFTPQRLHASLIKFWATLLNKIAQAKMKPIWQVSKTDVLRNQAAIVISNHQSYMDIVALQLLFPFPLYMLSKKELFWVPILGWGMKRFGIIRVDRQRGQNFIDEQIQGHLTDGKWVYFAPEGTRSPDGRLAKHFKSGAFRAAQKFKVPIVVVGIKDARKIIPKGSFWIRPNQKFTMTVLAVLNASEPVDVLKNKAYKLIDDHL
jgi:1-acyl-sn-glycerol-3-phosphate acyltransferase